MNDGDWGDCFDDFDSDFFEGAYDGPSDSQYEEDDYYWDGPSLGEVE